MTRDKLLVICGPTSTGKTSLAVGIAKKINGEIISADSRQVYKGMDIGTGKDLPANSKFKIQNSKFGGFYELDGVKIWGYDLVSPGREFSVAQYIKIANKIIENVLERGNLPIIVGGTGLYIRGLIDGIPTAEVPRNIELRENLEERSPDQLFEKLAELDSTKAASMNSSDRKNPRRLIRAIEVAQFYLNRNKISMPNAIGASFDIMFIGLNAPKVFIDQMIKKRVAVRLEQGLEQEIAGLLKSGVGWENQSMMSLGYRGWRDYFEGEVELTNVVDEWERDERKYAKRQMTWFKKDRRIIWFDITGKNYKEKVESLVKKWYSDRVEGKKVRSF
jgi:tRNA dimethylallyltransferase